MMDRARPNENATKNQTQISAETLSVVYVSRFLNLRATPQATTKLYVIRFPTEITFVICSKSRKNAGTVKNKTIIQVPLTGKFVFSSISVKIFGKSPSSA